MPVRVKEESHRIKRPKLSAWLPDTSPCYERQHTIARRSPDRTLVILIVLAMYSPWAIAVSDVDKTKKLTTSPNLTAREQGAVNSGFPMVVPSGLNAAEYYKLAEGYAHLELVRQAEEALSRASQSPDAGRFDEKIKILRATKLPRPPISDEELNAYLAAASIDYVRDLPMSRAALEDCIKKYPDFELPYSALAYREAWAKNWQRSIELAKKVLQINPQNTAALDTMGDSYLWLDKVDLAMAAFHQALQADPADRVAANRLSMEYDYHHKPWYSKKAFEPLACTLLVGALLARSCIPQTGYGFIDRRGKMVITAGYAGCLGFKFSDGLVAVDNGSKYWNTRGRRAFSKTFDEGREFSEGFACIKTGKRWGYIDTSGAVRISAQFDDAESFHNGLAAVCLGGKWGFIDRNGKLAVPVTYDGCLDFSDGLASVLKGGKIGFVNSAGDVVIPPSFDFADSFAEGLAIAGTNEGPTLQHHQVCINKEGKTVFDLTKLKQQYAGAAEYGSTTSSMCQDIMSSSSFRSCCSKGKTQFHEGLLAVKLGDKVGYVNTLGKIVVPPRFDRAYDFHEGLAAIVNGDLGGYIDHTGALVISARYRSIGEFSEGLAAVQINDRFGFIDKSGNLVVKPAFESVQPFSQGLAQVGSSRVWP
jgi:tetratricopeptide (TPR) repeat protein